MKRIKAHPGVSTAVVAAAVALSLTTAADASVAAVILQSRHTSGQRITKADSYGHWLDRLTDAARQLRRTVTGDGDADDHFAAAAAFAPARFLPDTSPAVVSPAPADAAPRHPLADLPQLIDLPPPTR